MINENELPKNWEISKIGKVCHIIMGQSPPSDTYNFEGIGLPFFQGKAEFTDLYPVVKKWCSEPNKIAEQNDILLSVRAPVGATNIANQKCCIGRGLAAIRFKNFKYVFYFLRSIEKELDEKGTGTTFKAISGETLRETDIPLPPLVEQERIVAKIEELFSELDAGLESLKTAQAKLKAYRQAVLKHAFEGKLTNDNVNEGKLPNGWKWEKLGNVIEQPKYGTSKKCDYNFEGLGVLRIPNIADGFIDATDLKFAEFDEKEIETYSLKDGDLLTIRSNGSIDLVGKCALITKKDEQFLYAGYLIRLRPQTEKLNSRFLLNVLSSSNLRNQIESKAKSTSGVNNINSEELKSLIIPICSLKEQQRIVEEVESRLSICDKLEETINISLKQSESLRQSILKQAFEGYLVPQDENDEPASVLLEQIQKERELFLEEEKLLKKQTIKKSGTKNMAEELKSILKLLEEKGEPIPTYTLWQSSIYKEDIDAFYAKVKELLEEGKIEETNRAGKESFLVHTASK